MSIVAAPCRRFTHAARWNGAPPQMTTGAASAKLSHCQLRNCSAGTIANTTTGAVSIAETTSLVRNACIDASPCSSSASSRACAEPSTFGTRAEYPVASTATIRSSAVRSLGNSTCARSVARFTVAVTPSSLLRRFSIRAAHDAQVMPRISRSSSRGGPRSACVVGTFIRALRIQLRRRPPRPRSGRAARRCRPSLHQS